MKTVFKIFFTAEGTRPFIVLFCLLLAGISEVFGMGTLLPLASNLTGGPTAHSSPLNHVITDGLKSFGLAPTLGTLVLLILAFLALRAALAFAALSYAGIAGARVSVNVRRQLIGAVFDARWGFYASQSSGKFANALSLDATRAGEAYLLAAKCIASLTQVTAYVLVTMFIDWRLSTMALVAGTVIVIAFAKLIKIAREAGARQNGQMEKLTTLMVDLLASIKPLKSMSRYQKLVSGMGVLLKGMRRAMVVRELSIQGMAQGSDLLIALMVGAGVFVANGFWKTPLPELVVSGVIFYQIVASISRLQRFVQQAASVENSYTRLTGMIDTASAAKEEQAGKKIPDIGAGCRLAHVTFSHGTRTVLRDVNVLIPANRLTVLQGPSGAGKTTLIDLLIGLHRPDKGRVLVGGISLEELDINLWRRQIGYVPQELHLLHASVRDNVALGDATISDERVVAALEQAGLPGLIRRGLDESVGELGAMLSGGQRQRLAIARALVTNPKLLILDEVTSALDPKTERAIVDSMTALKGEYTIVAITHRPAWSQAADRLYRIERRTAKQLKPAPAPQKKPPPKAAAQP